MKAEPTLLCIPDISGFTRFMGEIDFELSSKVIPALLNKIIYSNEVGLKVSEIEGDAVLFYRNGKLPSLQILIDQSRHFYAEFYHQIDILRNKNNGHPRTKRIPELLGLKIILHFGEEVGLVPIGKNVKLIGEDVIVAHRLLKNKIPIDEYVLISESLLSKYVEKDKEEVLDWSNLKSGSIEFNHLGTVRYRYIKLAPLQNT